MDGADGGSRDDVNSADEDGDGSCDDMDNVDNDGN